MSPRRLVLSGLALLVISVSEQGGFLAWVAEVGSQASTPDPLVSTASAHTPQRIDPALNTVLSDSGWGRQAVGNGDGPQSPGKTVPSRRYRVYLPLLRTVPPAFLGAEGHGALARGGRGGRVIEVTTLADSGAGSLRACMEASGPRTCVFRVSGIINLSSRITIDDPFLTVAGQTAPEGGITLRSEKGILETKGTANDIVLRHLRFRGYGGPEGDNRRAILIASGHHIILDHLSVSWLNDGLITIFVQPDTFSWSEGVSHITVQRTIVSEGETGANLKGYTRLTNPDGSADKNGVPQFYEGRRITWHHNLIANNNYRNPNVSTYDFSFINNVVYNWGMAGLTGHRKSYIDVVNNYFKAGPMGLDLASINHGREVTQDFDTNLAGNEGSPDNYTLITPTHLTWDGRAGPGYYLEGNIGPSNPDGNGENWCMTSIDKNNEGAIATMGDVVYGTCGMPLSINGVGLRRAARLPQSSVPVSEQSARAAYSSIIENRDVGTNARLDCEGNWVAASDNVDTRVIDDVINTTGPDGYQQIRERQDDAIDVVTIADPNDPRVCADSDHDGMPDGWEKRYSFDPSDPADGVRDANHDGYTNIEEYLNGTHPRR